MTTTMWQRIRWIQQTSAAHAAGATHSIGVAVSYGVVNPSPYRCDVQQDYVHPSGHKKGTIGGTVRVRCQSAVQITMAGKGFSLVLAGLSELRASACGLSEDDA